MSDILTILKLPTGQNGALVEYEIQDAGARDLISALGNAVYWIGVTTTELTDGATTNPITVNSESVTAKIGGMAQYSAEEFVWNGTAWQSIGKNNFGALAFKSSATGNFTPEGTVTVTDGADTTETITPFGSAGTVPSWSVSGTTATFSAGTAASAGSTVAVVTASGARTASFTGTQGSVTVQ